MTEFDPYLKWLAIPKSEQPANHYRLLAIPLFMDDADVIENAADQRMGHLRTFGSGKNGQEAQRLLNEIAAAKICLLNPSSRAAYDAELRSKMAAQETAEYQRPIAPAAAQTAVAPAPLPLAAGSPPVVASQQSGLTSTATMPSAPQTSVEPAPVLAKPRTRTAYATRSRSNAWQGPALIIAGLFAVILILGVAAAVSMTRIRHNRAVAEQSAARDQMLQRDEQARKAALAKQGNANRSDAKTNDAKKRQAEKRAQAKLAKQAKQNAKNSARKKPDRSSKQNRKRSEAPAVTSVSQTPLAKPTQFDGEYALHLPGANLLVVKDTANLTALDKEFTVDAWLRWPEDQVNGMHLLGNRPRGHDPPSEYGGWNLWFMAPLDKPEGKISLQYFLTPKKHHQMGPRPAISSERSWHHVAFSRTAKQYWICVNGQVVASEPLEIAASPDRSFHCDFCFGAAGGFWSSKNRGFQIGGVRFSSKARYQTSFTPAAKLTQDADTVALLDFSKPQSGVLKDLTGNGHDGAFKEGEWVKFAD